MNSGDPASAPARLTSWLGPGVLLTALVGLFAWTYGKWFDPIIDFGRELYVPWRLAEGDVLYRDIAWFNGPFSAYFNSLLFRVFGTSISTLVHANLVILGILTALLHSLLRDFADRCTAVVGCLVFLFLFGFAHFSFMGNFNYIAPYSHEATHGIVLGVAAFAATRRWSAGRGEAWLTVAGGLLGLTFLTKAEVFLAAGCGCLTQLVLHAFKKRPAMRACALASLRLLAGTMAVITLAFVLLAGELGVNGALIGTLGTWPWILSTEVENLVFYRKLTGLLDPRTNLLDIGLGAVRWALVFCPAMLVAWSCRRDSRLAAIVALASAPAAVAVLLRAVDFAVWPAILRPLPMIVLGCLAYLGMSVVRSREENEPARALLAWSVMSLVLLLKIVLAVNLAGYGFVLAMPAALLAVVAFLHLVPRWLEAHGRSGFVFRILTIAILVAVVLGNAVHATAWLSRKTLPVGRGADQFVADKRGEFLQLAFEEFDTICREECSLLVVPEGVMLNYLARTRNPSRHMNFMPPELVLFGEQSIVANLEASKPEFVIVTHRPTPDYGFQKFGHDFGQGIWDWVEEHYRSEIVYGGVPQGEGTDFGIELRVRRSDTDEPGRVPVWRHSKQREESPDAGARR